MPKFTRPSPQAIDPTEVSKWMAVLEPLLLELPAAERVAYALSIYPEGEEQFRELLRRLKRVEQRAVKAERLQEIDDLTGLYNERALRKSLRRLRRVGFHCAFLDMVGLGNVNNQLGNAWGDRALLLMVHALRSEGLAFGLTDRSMFRRGGGADEFLVFGPPEVMPHYLYSVVSGFGQHLIGPPGHEQRIAIRGAVDESIAVANQKMAVLKLADQQLEADLLKLALRSGWKL